jgi:fructokinase
MKILYPNSRLVSKLIIILFLSLSFIDCKKDNQAEELVELVWNYSQVHPEGFTLDVLKKAPVSNGIVVAYEETQNSFGKESIQKVVEHALDHDHIVGGWFNESDTSYYYDSDRVFEDGHYTEAIAFAKENHQLAIYDITHDSVIWIEYPKTVEFVFYSGLFSNSASKIVFFNSFNKHSARNAQ